MVFITLSLLLVAAFKLSVFADDSTLNKKPEVETMTLVNITEKPFTVDALAKKTSLDDLLLVLKIEESQPQSGVCNYFSSAMQFNQKKQELHFEVAKDFCANERFGKSKGEVYWTAPKSLALQKTKVCLVINNKKIGVLNLGELKNLVRIQQRCE